MVSAKEFLKEKEKWIQKVIKRPGRIKRLCGGEVTNDCLDKLERSAKRKGNRSLLAAVNLARKLRKMAKERKD